MSDDRDLHGGIFDHIPDTNRDGKIDMRDYHSWMDNADGEDDSDNSSSISDETYLMFKVLLGLGIGVVILFWLFR